MTALDRLAAELDGAAEQVHGARAVLARQSESPLAPLATAPGRLGEVGRRLAAQFSTAIQDRAEDLAVAADDLRRLADAARQALGSYRDAEDNVQHNLRGARDESR
jgi:hypothetical protein